MFHQTTNQLSSPPTSLLYFFPVPRLAGTSTKTLQDRCQGNLRRLHGNTKDGILDTSGDRAGFGETLWERLPEIPRGSSKKKHKRIFATLLVGGFSYPSEKEVCSSIGMMTFPTYYGKINTVRTHQPVFMSILSLDKFIREAQLRDMETQIEKRGFDVHIVYLLIYVD